MHRTSTFTLPLLTLLCALVCATSMSATPQFARRHELACMACHSLPPQLNEGGLVFAANGYRLPGRPAPGAKGLSLPATWLTLRQEDLGGSRAQDLYLPKVELVSGGALGERWSYFAEWRLVSQALRPDGSLQDRGGRFEDLYVSFSPVEEHSFKVGQYRALQQVDVSLRLSPSEPLLYAHGLPTDTYANPRLTALARFSPSGRSPSVSYSYRSLAGPTAADGLFHHLTVPFTGELSLPLSDEAGENASFELAGPKGIFAETYYRRGRNSVGVHALYDDQGVLATALGAYGWRNLIVTAGLGIEDREGSPSRERGSVEAEVHFAPTSWLSLAAGLRVEEVTDDGRRARAVPYLALAGPNTRHTLLLQIEYVEQEGNNTWIIDLSALF